MSLPETNPNPQAVPGVSHYNPVTVEMKEATGTAFLGILAVILLLSLLFLQRQNRQLVNRLADVAERPS